MEGNKYTNIMNRNFQFSEGEYYHAYSRGVEKRTIFLDDYDYKRFQALLYLCNGTKQFVYRDLPIGSTSVYRMDMGKKLVAVAAYVLMPNHFHLILKEIKENGITEFMRKLLTAYSMYFNKKHDRVGPLFQGTFKAKHLDTDEYLKYQFSYTHLNPIKLINPKWKEEGISNLKKAKDYLGEYSYSSYPEYIGTERKKREEAVILNREEFPDYFEDSNSFKDFINEWLQYKEEIQYIGSTSVLERKTKKTKKSEKSIIMNKAP